MRKVRPHVVGVNLQASVDRGFNLASVPGSGHQVHGPAIGCSTSLKIEFLMTERTCRGVE
jgi:hypothetical protein